MTVWQLATFLLGMTLGACAGSASCSLLGAAGAANGAIEGQIRDTIGQPLPGTTVTVIPERGGPARQTIADGEGAYRLDGLADGTYRIDFQLTGFDRTRDNHVRVRADTQTNVDATLQVSAVCECVTSGLSITTRPQAGQVVDEANRPLPYARLEVVSSLRRETAYSDSEGRFYIRAPLEGAWPITASDSGFASVTQKISKTTSGPIVLTLRRVGTTRLPNRERFRLGCLCPEYFGQRE
jgi:hypothetical protein